MREREWSKKFILLKKIPGKKNGARKGHRKSVFKLFQKEKEGKHLPQKTRKEAKSLKPQYLHKKRGLAYKNNWKKRKTYPESLMTMYGK